MDIEDLEIDAVRTRLRHLSALRGLSLRESAEDGGFRALLVRGDGEEEVFFAVAPRGGGYVSFSIVLVVDEEFFRGNAERVLEATARHEVSAGLTRDGDLAEGEVYLSLSHRIYLAGLTEEVFGLVLQNLRAARLSLEVAFP